MKVTKIGHCCLLIEENGLRILTDPGAFTTGQNKLKNIDVVLITHEHNDHIHVGSLKMVLENSPRAHVITNRSVGIILGQQNIAAEIVEDGQKTEVGSPGKKVIIEGHGTIHAEVYKTIPRVQNTGYLIAGKLYMPGDAFHNPKKPVDVLALPVAGPWMKLSEAIDYALAVKPRIAFPIHDGLLNNFGTNINDRMAPMVFEKAGIKFVSMKEGSVEEF